MPIRPLLLPLAGILGAGPLAFAQARFDIATFTAPPGWKAAQDGDHFSLTHVDNAAGTYCILGVYASRSASGDPVQEFKAEWTGIVQNSYSAGESPVPKRGTTAAGLTFLEGTGTATWDGRPMLVRLLVFPVRDRVLSVMVVASHAAALTARQGALQAFLGSLRLGGGAASTPQASSGRSPSPTAVTGREGPWKGGGISGVWMGFTFLPGTGSYEPQPRWYLFFDDGQVFKDLPIHGPAGFDRAASQADDNHRPYWGSYRISAGSGEITTPGVRFSTRLVLDRKDSMLVDNERFYRSLPLDGLRLDGAWTTYGSNDAEVLQRPIGQRPVIRFSRDGRFSDEGLFAAFLHGVGGDETPGRGTYDIRDFTLFLRFDDGRVKQVAITATVGGKAAVDSDILWIGRSRLNRMR